MLFADNFALFNLFFAFCEKGTRMRKSKSRNNSVKTEKTKGEIHCRISPNVWLLRLFVPYFPHGVDRVALLDLGEGDVKGHQGDYPEQPRKRDVGGVVGKRGDEGVFV